MASRNPAEVIVGAAVLAVAAGFLTYAMANSGRSTVHGYPLTAQFENIAGLSAGADVRMAGVKIGAVESTSINPSTYQAIVTLRVREDIHLPRDSAAQILSDGLLGSQYIGLSPGGEDKMLSPGGQIAITTPAVSLEQELGKFVFSVSDLVTTIKKNPVLQGGEDSSGGQQDHQGSSAPSGQTPPGQTPSGQEKGFMKPLE